MTRLALVLALVLGTGVAAGQSLPAWAEPGQGPVEPEAPVTWDPMMTPTPPPVPSVVPIDGGLGLLALAGGAYAVRRLRRR